MALTGCVVLINHVGCSSVDASAQQHTSENIRHPAALIAKFYPVASITVPERHRSLAYLHGGNDGCRPFGYFDQRDRDPYQRRRDHCW
jgi:hypothetical protein